MSGRRFGTLVHTLLALINLESTTDALKKTAAVQRRTLPLRPFCGHLPIRYCEWWRLLPELEDYAVRSPSCLERKAEALSKG